MGQDGAISAIKGNGHSVWGFRDLAERNDADITFFLRRRGEQ